MRKFPFSFVQSIPLFAALFASLFIVPFSHANTLTIQGSNTIGAKLAPALVTGYLQSLGARDVELLGTKENESRITAQIDSSLNVNSNKNSRVEVDIAAHGSSTGFRALLKQEADIAAASRPAKQKEIEQLAEFAELTSPRSEHIIGIDGLAIILHPNNPINELSVEQVAAIFAGEIRNWTELGGRFGEINLYSRDNKSGTWDSFKRMVLGKAGLDSSALRFEANDKLSDEVSSDINGIGFVGLPSVRRAKLIAISDGAAKALKPTQLTISTEDYALSRRLYFYTDDDSKNPHVRSFIKYVQSSEGQEIVADNGFIAQNIEVVEPINYSELPLAFQLLAGDGQRLTVNFRFKEGSARLDNRALMDIQRLVDFSVQNPDKKLILIGFGDQKKSQERSQLLSKLRAMAVRRELVKQGIYPKFNYGYGEQLPVASNQREAGKLKNRRVEVWLTDID
jgi:phosphate transport system substrate-binding protein